MSTRYPVGGGLRNGFERYRIAYHEQPFNADTERFLGYPNALLNNSGHWTPTPMSYMAGIPQRAAPAQDAIFSTPMANDDRRRRSSAMSPRTMRASNFRTPYSDSFPPDAPQTLTPPASSPFGNHPEQTQVGVEAHHQAFARPSLSTITTTTRTSTTSTYTETPTAKHGHNQRATFALLSETCTEALRRKWHDETQRQLLRSLTSRRPRRRQRSRGRYSPYAALSAVPHPHSHAGKKTQRGVAAAAAAATTEQPLHFIDLMQRIATATWENAIHQHQQQQQQQHPSRDQPQPQGHDDAASLNPRSASVSASASAPPSAPRARSEAETAAIESMRTLYSLGNDMVAASEAAERGESFSLDEVRDIVEVAAGLCRFLGYGEGARRCKEVGKGLLGAGVGVEALWEGEVL